MAGVLGAIAGSFLNVIAYRLPRRESLIMPGSHCPVCGAPVRPYDNVPILSYLLLRGRCRSCSAAISRRYPLVEVLTAGLCAGAVLAHPTAAGFALSVALILLLVPAALLSLVGFALLGRIETHGDLDDKQRKLVGELRGLLSATVSRNVLALAPG